MQAVVPPSQERRQTPAHCRMRSRSQSRDDSNAKKAGSVAREMDHGVTLSPASAPLNAGPASSVAGRFTFGDERSLGVLARPMPASPAHWL